MISKVLKIVLDAVISFVVFLIIMLIGDVIAGKVVGVTKALDGSKVLKGGGATSVTMIIVSFAITIAFAVWFYGFLNRKNKTVKE